MLEGFIGFCICAIVVMFLNEFKAKPLNTMIDKFKSAVTGNDTNIAEEAIDNVCANITKLNQEAYISSIIDSLEKCRSELNRYKALYIEYRDKCEELRNQIKKLENDASKE